MHSHTHVRTHTHMNLVKCETSSDLQYRESCGLLSGEEGSEAHYFRYCLRLLD